MPVDVEIQLIRYGDLLRESMEVPRPPTHEPSGEPAELMAVVSTAVLPTVAHRRHRQRRRRSRAGFVAALALAVTAMGGGLAYALGRVVPPTGGSDLVGAVAVEDPSRIERRPGDTDAFVDRLDDVDHELVLGPGREPTAVERAALIDRFPAPEGRRLDPGSVAVALEFGDGFLLVTFDVTDAAPVGANRLHCQAVVRQDGDELRNNNGHSCWDPARPPPAPVDGDSPQFAYGCQPAGQIFGLVAFGRGDFTAEVYLPPGSPGVLFTLENGDTVLVRPVDDLVVYAGPAAIEMEIFHPGGRVDTVDTSNCD